MKMLQKVCFVLLLSAFSNIYADGCKYGNINDCYGKAEQGDSLAQLVLGVMYAMGEGVAKDYKQAVEWYMKSAKQGNANAQYSLGIMYYEGLGILKDEEQAIKWWEESSNQGYASATYILKFFHLQREVYSSWMSRIVD